MSVPYLPGPRAHRGGAATSLAPALPRGLSFAAMFVLAATAAFATAGGPDHFLVRNVSKGSVLNIRAAPDREAEILGTIPHDGDGIRNLGCEGLMDFADWQTASEAEREAAADRVWCRIEYGGITGWSAGRFLGEGSAP